MTVTTIFLVVLAFAAGALLGYNLAFSENDDFTDPELALLRHRLRASLGTQLIDEFPAAKRFMQWLENGDGDSCRNVMQVIAEAREAEEHRAHTKAIRGVK